MFISFAAVGVTLIGATFIGAMDFGAGAQEEEQFETWSDAQADDQDGLHGDWSMDLLASAVESDAEFDLSDVEEEDDLGPLSPFDVVDGFDPVQDTLELSWPADMPAPDFDAIQMAYDPHFHETEITYPDGKGNTDTVTLSAVMPDDLGPANVQFVSETATEVV